MKRIVMLITMMAILLIWCNGVLSDEIGYGEIEGGVYSNSYFNMSISVPDRWHVQCRVY